ncbi:hypothetical protein [Bosea sp. NBC_00550]|uniref:hypothetical protein n=1 Tax=Bosea sp. NBC_00550 TaxID=2969621 RepID=UPI00222FE921|nr:hypothetical protein [Bosea sp. NBC_00550]UZF94828.1 hypothetical protein NWE53_11960 [Bosea sp. NBC_00550]
MAEKRTAPWTDEQVAALNLFQVENSVHLLCGGDRTDDAHRAYQAEHGGKLGQLVAIKDGLVCPVCGYRLQWAHGFWLPPPPSSPATPSEGQIIEPDDYGEYLRKERTHSRYGYMQWQLAKAANKRADRAEARALAAEVALAAARERVEQAIRDCLSLDENGNTCEKAVAIAAIRSHEPP